MKGKRKKSRRERRKEGQTMEDKRTLVPRQRMRRVQKPYVGLDYVIITNNIYNISCSQKFPCRSSESMTHSDAIWWCWPLSMCLLVKLWQEKRAGELQPLSNIYHCSSGSHEPPDAGGVWKGMCHTPREEGRPKCGGALVMSTTSCVLAPKSKERQLAKHI